MSRRAPDRVVARCADYERRFPDRASAERWVAGVVVLGACRLEHEIVELDPEESGQPT